MKWRAHAHSRRCAHAAGQVHRQPLVRHGVGAGAREPTRMPTIDGPRSAISTLSLSLTARAGAPVRELDPNDEVAKIPHALPGHAGTAPLAK